MFNKINIIIIVSIILIFILNLLLLHKIIVKKNSKYIEQFTNKDILKVCPRGCGHHYSVPNCDECIFNTKEYSKSSLEDREWIDSYHIKGDYSEKYAKYLVEKWKNINKSAVFRFNLINKNVIIQTNIHPLYQSLLYEKYNPEKDRNNVNDIINWIKQINYTGSTDNLVVVKKTNNWKYIDIKPENDIIDIIHNIVIDKNLASLKYYKDNVLQTSQDTDDIDIKLKNICDVKIDIFSNKNYKKSFEYAKLRWEKIKDMKIEEYVNYIINNINNGEGFHIDDIIYLFSFQQQKGLQYIDKIIEKLKEAEKKKEEKLKENNGMIDMLLKASCQNKDNKYFTELSMTKMNVNDYIWPIFKRKDTLDTNLKELNNIQNICKEYTLCNNNNGSECLFVNDQ